MNAADQESKTPKWTDIARDPDFQASDWQTKQRVRGEFYRRAIEPNTPASLRADVQSQFFSRTEQDVFGERAQAEAPSEPETRGLFSNALRNAGERGLDLTGNALQFVGNMADKGEQRITEALGGINPGVIGGSAEEMRSRGYEPDIELGGYGLDFTMRAKPEDTSTGLIDSGQAIEDISLGYQPNYTIDRALDEPSLKTIAGAAAEQGPAALADMAGLVISLPAYLAARTQEIGEARVTNDGREGMPEGGDYAVSGPTAAASVLLDRFALGRLLPGGKNAVTSARQIPGAVGRASVTEGITEAIQEGGIEYAGESVGTEAGWDPVTAGRRAAGGVIVGAPTGGAVRGGTATMELRSNGQRDGGQPESSEAPVEQPAPIQEDAVTPEAEIANVEAVGTATELIAKPRFELSSAEREVRDSISYGDAFKALRSAAEARGDTEAVNELDAVSGEISAALEAETMARTRNDSEAFTPIREQLQNASERFAHVMERLNTPETSAEINPPATNDEGNTQWKEAWREQAAEDGITDYDPNANLPDTTIDVEGRPAEVAGEVQTEAHLAQQSETIAPEPAQAPDQPSPNPERMTPKRVPVANIQVDPEAYQFRSNVNQDGVDSRLEGVEKWDDLRAGNLVLHERLDGALYAADGHHRINLARQLEQPDVNALVLREADGVTVEDARIEAATANIAAGSATAIDAAKVFRNTDVKPAEAINRFDLPRKSPVVRDGIDIAKLANDAFGAVLNGVVTEKDGATIGRAFSDPDQQMAAIEVFQRVKPTNDNQRALLANEVRQAGFTESQGEQGGLFGEDPAESLIGERVRVMDSLRQTLVRDRRLFATLNENAQTAEKAGNRIAKDQNNALQDASAEAVALLERATTTPEINQQINDAARRVKDGEALASVTRELKEALLNGPDATAAQQPRTSTPGDGSVNQTGQDAGRSAGVSGLDDARTAGTSQQRVGDDAGQQQGSVTLKTNGQPFQTRRAVELSQRFRDTPNAIAVETEGGWGFVEQNGVAVQSEQSGSNRQPQAITWQRRAKGSRVWLGSDGTVIADYSISSGGNRIPLFMAFADQQAYDQGNNFASGKTLTEAKQLAATAERPQSEQFLETQTEESLALREQQTQQSEQAETQQRFEAEQRAQADRDAEDFRLSGSDRQADIATAGGQADLLSAQPSSKSQVTSNKQRKPASLTPRQQRVSDAFGGAVKGDTINLLTDVGYSKAGNAYTIDSINKDGTLQATNVERGSSVLISQGDWTLATRRTKAPIAEVVNKGRPDDARYSVSSISAVATKAPRATDITAALKEKPELADARIVQSTAELPADALQGMILRGINPADVRGMFIGGELYVVADNVLSVEEAVRTAVHESVGHKGMRGVLGAELEPLMLEVYKSHTRSQAGRDNIAAIQAAYPFINVTTHKGKVTLAEELVAHYIEESNSSPTLSQRVKSTIRRLLRKLFPSIEWRTNDILMLGEQSRRWLRRQQAQRDLVSQDDALYSLMEEQSSISPRELSKQLREEFPGLKLDMAGRGQRIAISRIVSPTQGEGIGSEVMRRLTQWADASGKTLALTPSSDFGGSIRRLRAFYKRAGFVENKGKNKDYEISETMYREPDHGAGEQRFSLNTPPGTPGGNFSSTDSTNFSMPDEALADAAIRKMADKMRPLKILEDAIRRSGRAIEEEADAYLAEELFHGKAEYDLRQLREQYVEPLAEGLASSKINQSELDDYLYARHAPERNATIAERNPDKPDMQDGGSGMTNARAAEIIDKVANSGKQAQYDRLAKIVYDMTRLRREAIREGGLENDTVVDAWEAAWQYYVPLKGNAADEPGRPKTGRGFEVSGRESRTAAGRKSIADSPSSQVIVDANESLIRRRKNEVAQSLLSLVTDHPNPSLWEVFTESNPDMQRSPVTITDPDTGKNRIEVQERPVNMAGNDKYFKVKRAGRTYYLKIHDERLMNAMRNVGPENNGLLIRMASTATRAMSAMMTSYNPEFMLTNFTRDVQTALLNLSAEQTRDDGKIKGEAIVRQTARDIGPAMKAAWRGLQNKPGKNDSGREWDTWFKEFQADGAKTGYFDMKDISSQAKEIQSMVRRADGTTLSHMLKARKKTADFVENMNGAVENAVRLSAYTNARRAGVSRKQAASLAKNMTVNFNRRGEAGTALNAAYMFANASIQGTMNFARTMITTKNTPDGKSPMNVWARANMAQKLAFGMASGAFALGMLNRWASEEDEDGVLFYDKVPDHVKERNIVIMSSLWGGEPEDFVSIPLPYGYNVFSVIGTHAEAVAADTLDATEAAKNLGLAILGSFSPIGWEDSDSATGLLMKNLTPTLVRSFAQVGFNEDFAGRLIYKDDLPFGTPTPQSSRAMPSTPEPYKAIASFLNDVTGGSEYRTGSVDINPGVMQHLVNYYGGGAWGFVEKTSSFAARVVTGEEVERYRIPFAGRFASSTSPYRDQGLFYERRDELGQIANEADALKGRERIDFRRDNAEQIRLFNSAKNIEKQLQEDRKRRDRIQETETLSDEAKKNRVEMIERQMKRRIDDFNRRYNELSD
ncbi:LPD38 domain-containing protein [Vreelandella zhanjiangensis]|uniref:LPD38 domain-containing protein n=1 Tax=Vreelandella zhanjiangensis TaxID=1121960 RepID=UPI00402AFC82